MFRRFILILSVALLALTAGCARHQQLKSKVSQPGTCQVATADWQSIVASLANRINNRLIQQNYIDRSVYISPACYQLSACSQATTAFDRVFRELLTAKLLEYGVPTTDKRTPETLDISYTTQVLAQSNMGYWGPKISAKVLITTSIISNNRYIFSQSDIYRLNSDEFRYYQKATPATVIGIASEKKTDALPLKQTPEAEEILLEPQPLF
ncbi:hypothetical protein [Desulfotalea psychrophila]|uniref:FlgO domain-containing protein n=1 Tax=Desulfotalea psychrophila (strain LSv54 / DSM 12343) TaxID=177439 RepID=Q6AKA4_DESPS|nr:hypothetical protein [Desulfotalea psychrophila]CAG37222.1 unknown protein [Desulfotalea psychrophila LSv54]